VLRGAGETVYRRTMDLLSDLPGFVVGAFLFIFALYYFLAEGPQILQGWESLSPLDAEHDRTIRSEFCKVCRGVVWATLAAAVAQGVLVALGLAAIDFFFNVGLGRWFFLIGLATTVFSMVPFVGAFAVWGTVMIVFAFQGQYGAAVALLLYGLIVVSMADNVTKIVVLKGSANLHPLLAFICVFGGIDLFGVLGIFVGPIIGAVLVSLMRILKQEMLTFGRSEESTSSIAP
jgi:predicted PurR-regulated permease PerM